MSSSSSSSLASGSCNAGSRLPLIPCKLCKGKVIELSSKNSDTKWRKFFRCTSKKEDGSPCDFFHWLGSYAVLLIKDRIVTDADSVTRLLLMALEDHDQAISSLTMSIRDTKQNLEHLEAKMGNLEANMGNLENLEAKMEVLNKSMMAEKEENKKMAAALDEMKTDLQKLKYSTTVKGSTAVKLGNMALFVLLLALIGWFVMGHEVEEAFRLMLSP